MHAHVSTTTKKRDERERAKKKTNKRKIINSIKFTLSKNVFCFHATQVKTNAIVEATVEIIIIYSI